jgi:hypothetical protein
MFFSGDAIRNAASIDKRVVTASLGEPNQAFQIKGVVFKEIHDVSPKTRLSLAWRRTDTSPFLKNFLASASGDTRRFVDSAADRGAAMAPRNIRHNSSDATQTRDEP